MLHIQGRQYIDARRQQFLDVLPALRMARPLDIRVREFIDQDQGGAPQQGCV